jgi:hypothetical protein
MNIEQTRLEFEHWKGMAATVALREAIQKHKESFVKFISDNANSEMNSERLRYAANGIKTCDAILAFSSDINLLFNKLGIVPTTQENANTKK